MVPIFFICMLPEVRYCDKEAHLCSLFLGIFCTFDPGLKRYIGLTMPTESSYKDMLPLMHLDAYIRVYLSYRDHSYNHLNRSCSAISLP